MELETPIDSAHLLAPYQSAVQEAENQNKPLDLGNHLVNLGLVQFSVQDYKNGMENLDQAVQIAQKENLALEQTIAVGDGANDLPMITIAGLGVAFNAKPVVRQKASNTISSVGLDGLLYLIGIHEREIRHEVRPVAGNSYG